MRRRPIVVLLALTLGVALAPLPALAVPGLGLVGSAADPDPGAALDSNPAGLGVQPGQHLFIAPPAGPGAAAAAFTSWGDWGLGWTQGPQVGQGQGNLVELGSAGDLWPGGRLGTTVKWGGSLDWDLGLLLRPLDFLSVGAVGLNVAQSSGLNRLWDVGVGVRPFTDRVTLTADVLWTGLPTPQLALGAQVEPLDGIRLRGWAQPQVGSWPGSGSSVGVGVALRLPNFEVGGMGGLAPGGYLAYDEAVQPSVFIRPGSTVAVLDLRDGLASPVGNPLAAFVERPAVFPVLEAIAAAQQDPEVGALALRVSGLDASMAELEELRTALHRFRRSGKKVVAYLADASLPAYFLAIAADRVVLNPVAELDVSGVSKQFTFLAGTMQKLGVTWDVVAQGHYKTAPEQMTRKDLSPANREQYQAYLDDVFARFVAAMGQDRHLPEARVRQLVDHGMFTAREAMDAGLVDGTSYSDEVRDQASRLLGQDHGPAIAAGDRTYASKRWAPVPAIAVVLVKGELAGGASRTPFLSGKVAGARTVSEAIAAARRDGAKALVVRVESPGGETTAAEDIRREIERTRQAKVPVVVSMGDVAASGGYWLSTPADRIYADGTTLTGSIGVFAMKPNLAGLYDKLGASVGTLKIGKHADMDSQVRAFTPEERALIGSQTQEIYGQFVDRVARGRHLSTDAVVKVAGGRVWSGDRARTLGLVDEIGGLAEAMGRARFLAHLDGPVRTAFYPVRSPFGLPGIEDTLSAVRGDDRDLVGLKDDLVRLRELARGGVRFEALPPGATP